MISASKRNIFGKKLETKEFAILHYLEKGCSKYFLRKKKTILIGVCLSCIILHNQDKTHRKTKHVCSVPELFKLIAKLYWSAVLQHIFIYSRGFG